MNSNVLRRRSSDSHSSYLLLDSVRRDIYYGYAYIKREGYYAAHHHYAPRRPQAAG